jgi:hypothetical protein
MQNAINIERNINAVSKRFKNAGISNSIKSLLIMSVSLFDCALLHDLIISASTQNARQIMEKVF